MPYYASRTNKVGTISSWFYATLTPGAAGITVRADDAFSLYPVRDADTGLIKTLSGATSTPNAGAANYEPAEGAGGFVDAARRKFFFTLENYGNAGYITVNGLDPELFDTSEHFVTIRGAAHGGELCKWIGQEGYAATADTVPAWLALSISTAGASYTAERNATGATRTADVEFLAYSGQSMAVHIVQLPEGDAGTTTRSRTEWTPATPPPGAAVQTNFKLISFKPNPLYVHASCYVAFTYSYDEYWTQAEQLVVETVAADGVTVLSTTTTATGATRTVSRTVVANASQYKAGKTDANIGAGGLALYATGGTLVGYAPLTSTAGSKPGNSPSSGNGNGSSSSSGGFTPSKKDPADDPDDPDNPGGDPDDPDNPGGGSGGEAADFIRVGGSSAAAFAVAAPAWTIAAEVSASGEWSVECDADWIAFEREPHAAGTEISFPFDVAKNDSGATREATLRFSLVAATDVAATVTVAQYPGETIPEGSPELSVSPARVAFPSEGGTAWIAVDANCAWRVESSGDGADALSVFPDVETGLVYFYTHANSSGGARSGTLRFYVPTRLGGADCTELAASVEWTQSAPPEDPDAPRLELVGAARLAFPAEGGAATVGGVANCAWRVECEGDAVSVPVEGGVAGAFSFDVVVASNADFSTRSGTLRFYVPATFDADAPLDVLAASVEWTQAPRVADHALALDRDSAAFPATGGDVMLRAQWSGGDDAAPEIFVPASAAGRVETELVELDADAGTAIWKISVAPAPVADETAAGVERFALRVEAAGLSAFFEISQLRRARRKRLFLGDVELRRGVFLGDGRSLAMF